MSYTTALVLCCMLTLQLIGKMSFFICHIGFVGFVLSQLNTYMSDVGAFVADKCFYTPWYLISFVEPANGTWRGNVTRRLTATYITNYGGKTHTWTWCQFRNIIFYIKFVTNKNMFCIVMVQIELKHMFETSLLFLTYAVILSSMHVDGGNWTSWNISGECSVTCGYGSQAIQRRCIHDYRSMKRKVCVGDHVASRYCFRGKCPNNRFISQTDVSISTELPATNKPITTTTLVNAETRTTVTTTVQTTKHGHNLTTQSTSTVTTSRTNEPSLSGPGQTNEGNNVWSVNLRGNKNNCKMNILVILKRTYIDKYWYENIQLPTIYIWVHVRACFGISTLLIVNVKFVLVYVYSIRLYTTNLVTHWATYCTLALTRELAHYNISLIWF